MGADSDDNDGNDVCTWYISESNRGGRETNKTGCPDASQQRGEREKRKEKRNQTSIFLSHFRGVCACVRAWN